MKRLREAWGWTLFQLNGGKKGAEVAALEAEEKARAQEPPRLPGVPAYVKLRRHRTQPDTFIYGQVADGWGFDPLEGVEIGALAYGGEASDQHDDLNWDWAFENAPAWPTIEGADA